MVSSVSRFTSFLYSSISRVTSGHWIPYFFWLPSSLYSSFSDWTLHNLTVVLFPKLFWQNIYSSLVLLYHTQVCETLTPNQAMVSNEEPLIVNSNTDTTHVEIIGSKFHKNNLLLRAAAAAAASTFHF